MINTLKNNQFPAIANILVYMCLIRILYYLFIN